MSSHDVVRIGTDRLRISHWRGDPHVALVTPVAGRLGPRPESVEHCVRLLGRRGYREAVTSALTAREQAGFLAQGFAARERLHLLSRDLDPRGAWSGWGARSGRGTAVEVRRARRRDRPEVLAVDAAAFSSFWRFDDTALGEALAATPTSRFRLAEPARDGGRRPRRTPPTDEPRQGAPAGHADTVGYAITGRSRSRGYLQRLAVHPRHQREGVGSALVLDALRWLARHGVRTVVVNTQEENEAALRLYERLGFVRQDEPLVVLAVSLGRSAVGAGAQHAEVRP